VVCDLALELGGPRALRAVSPTASLERDIGLGSLDRVELLLRLESAFDRELGDRFLLLDSADAIARAILESAEVKPLHTTERAALLPAASAIAPDVATIHEALRLRATAEPHRTHVFLHGDEGADEEITYGLLWESAAAIAGGLRERGVRKGDTVALMFPTGMDFLRCFQGILIAQAIPVPLYPPVRLDWLEEYLLRQSGILGNAGARILISIEQALPVASVLRRAVPSIAELTTADSLARSGAPATTTEGSATDPALIQYTSGSTGSPKGVLLTHANLLANIRAISAGVALLPTDVGVSWLPLYHDMGLIGTWLCALVQGVPIALQSPLSFLARPERWLWTIHQRRGTLSAAPNFAYELCVRKIPDAALEGLDLSSWRCALNGSEPVSPDTLERFARRFERYGFRREALMPVYGLAECAVALSFPPPGRGPLVDSVARTPFERESRALPVGARESGALRFVSVGVPLPEHELRIVNGTGDDVPERTVGRLVFRGPSVMAGYYRSPEMTRSVTLPGGWIDSGDLAYRAAGELFITGRIKDLIIAGGRNIVPQEVEEIVGSVEGVRKGCVAAFGVADEALGTERLVVVAETRLTDRDARSKLDEAIVARVSEGIGLPPEQVLIADPGSVLKTSSGKIRRGATKELYTSGRLGRRQTPPLARRLTLAAAAGKLAIRAGLARVGYALYFVWVLLALAMLAIVSWALAAVLPGRRSVFLLQRVASRVALRIVGCQHSVEGLEHLDGVGAAILASNHTSYVDIAALVSLLPMDFLFVAKREVLSWPLIGTLVRRGRHPTVDRWDPRHSVVDARAITEVARRGESVLFFPEGTFTAAAGLRPFRMGAFEAAVETLTPVVPIAIRGARHVLRDDELRPHRGRVHVWVGSPIAPPGATWQDALDLRSRVADAIAAHCGEPRLDLVAGGPAPR
jgi:1-acyl-sn-glycerol-3-phosphate acyltransferase